MELLIVIAIIAVLTMAVILYIDPIESLRASRDSTRLNDIDSLRKAITFYVADLQNPEMGTSTVCYIGNSIGPSLAGCQQYFQTATAVATNTSIDLNGAGWVPIDFRQISTGLPLDRLPVDPKGVNDPDYFYSYIVATNSTFKLAAKMESKLYGFGGARDVVSTDGGISTTTYETGTDIAL